MKDFEKLETDLKQAVVAAKRAADGVDDGGTCNMDSVIIPTGKTHPLARASKKLDEIFRPFGGTRVDWGWQAKGYMLTYSHGQADKRTVATEAAKTALAAWDAYVHYLID